ncbi:MAG: LysR family transcriptional regulator [Alphaproteobacteria bacterium]
MNERYSEIDYNLFKVLLILYHYRNLKKVGLALGISESATSKKITKLRQILKDDIFIRSSHEMELTPLVMKIVPQLEQHYDEITQIIDNSEQQDFCKYTKPIVVALITNFYNIAVPLTKNLQKVFPKAPLYMKHWNANTLNDIEKNTMNIGVYLGDIEHPKKILQHKLIETPIYMVSHKDIRINELKDIYKYRVVVTDFPQWNEYNQFYILQKLNIMPDNLIHVDSIHIAQAIVQNMHCISFLPQHMCNEDNLNITPLDKFLNRPVKYKLALFYKQALRNDKLTQKLCSVISQTIIRDDNF